MFDQKVGFKKFLSLFMSMLLIVGLLPISSFAEGTNTVPVTLQIDGHWHRNATVGETILTEKTIDIEEGKTVADVVNKYIAENNVESNITGEGSSYYIAGLHGLQQREYGDDSGWYYFVWNDATQKYELPNVGMGAYTINAPKKVKLVYTIENILFGYQSEKKKSKEIVDTMLASIDKTTMSGKIAAMLYNTSQDIPQDYENTVKANVAKLTSSSSMEDYWDVILGVLAVQKNPYNAWGRNLIEEVGKRDVLNSTIDDMIFALAIQGAGSFEMNGALWNADSVKNKLKTLQNSDGSFGEGTDSQKIITTARVYNFAELTSFDPVARNIEDYLANQMHPAGGFPVNKEDGITTAEVVLALANRSKDTTSRISYRVPGNWQRGVSPYNSFIDFFLKSKSGFKKDLLDKEIDQKMTEISTLAIARVNQYQNNPQFAGRSLFKFDKVQEPTDTEKVKQKIDKIYEDILAREKANNSIDDLSAYIIKRMGENLSDAQKEHLGEVNTKPTSAFAAYTSMLKSIAKDDVNTKSNITSIVDVISKMQPRQTASASKGMYAFVAGNMTDTKISDESQNNLKSVFTYKLYKTGQTTFFLTDKFSIFAAVAELSNKAEEKANIIENLGKIISTNNASDIKAKKKVAELFASLNILGEDVLDAKYTTKDGRKLYDLLLEEDLTADDMFLAAASFKLKNLDGSNIFKYEFKKTIEEKIDEVIARHVNTANLKPHILKKYDDRDIAEAVQTSKTTLENKATIKVTPDKHDIFNLLAGNIDITRLEGKNIVELITKDAQPNKKIENINTLLVLNATEFTVPSTSAENKDTLKEKVKAIKEFRDNTQSQYSVADAGEAMIVLAPYYKANDAEVVNLINNFIAKIKPKMKNDGTLDTIGENIPHPIPYRSDQVAKLVQGLIHLGIDPHRDERLMKNGKSLIDGLLLYETPRGFTADVGDETKTFQTEKVLETLIDYKLFKENKKLIYDYSDFEIPSGETKYDMTINVTPAEASDTTISITKKDSEEVIAKEDGAYKLPAGEYTLTATKDGYKNKVQDFTVTNEEASHTVNVAMEIDDTALFIFNPNTNTITGYKTKDVPENLVIPAEINGVAVKHIGKEAFKFSSTSPNYSKLKKPLKSLTLPEGLETLAMSSFQGADITEITIPSTVREINGALRLSEKLETVNFAENSQLQIIGEDTFYNSSIKSIDLPAGVTKIGKSAFHGSKLENITLPEGLTEIETQAFSLSNVQELTIPQSVTKLNLDSRGREGINGLFFRTFSDEAKSKLTFTRVYDNSGIATLSNTTAIVNPVEVTIKYVDESGQAIAGHDEVKAVGINKKVITQFKAYRKELTIEDGDNSYLTDYNNPYSDTAVYNKKQEKETVFGNYFTKGTEWEFAPKTIAGYTAPANITKTLTNNKEEVVFVYTQDNQKFNLSFEGDGITSDVEAGQKAPNTEVNLVIHSPENKKFKRLLVNDEEVQVTDDGITQKYTFTVTKDSAVKVEYDDATYEKEIELSVTKDNVKLGDKFRISVKYKGEIVPLTSESLIYEFNEDILVLDKNTGDVTAVGSGTVALTVKLKHNEDKSDSNDITITPVRVTLRVEDVDKTLIEKTNVEISNLKVKKGVDYYENITFTEPVPFLAVKEVLKAKGVDTKDKEKFNFSADGNWMIAIGDLNPGKKYGEYASFMYAVNNVMANKGAGQFTVVDGDNIVIYVIKDYAEPHEGYSYFEKEEYTVKANEELTLKLSKAVFNMANATQRVAAVESAKLLNNTTPLLKDGNPVLSDSQGVFKYKFTQEGEYIISASKIVDGEEQIGRPYAIVRVSGVLEEKTVTALYSIAEKTVANNTAKENIGLPASINATLSDNTTVSIPLTWESSTPEYNASKAGRYKFVANYELPDGVTGDKPEVACYVNVENPQTPSVDIDEWVNNKIKSISDDYASKEKTNDWWKIAEQGKLGIKPTEQDLEFIKKNVLNEDGTLKTNDPGTLLKTVLALRASGIDPENYYGHNIVEKLINTNTTSIWTDAPKLWALSSDDYNSEGLEDKIDELINKLISSQKADGSWDSWGWQDATGFALYALAPHIDREDVASAVEKAVGKIAQEMDIDGDLKNTSGQNANSLAMVVGGLLSNKAEYLKDPRLIKNGKTLLDGLKKYDVEGAPEFLWKTNSTTGKPMATEQSFRALVTYKMMKDNKGYVFDYRGMPKVAVSNTPATTEKTITSVEALENITVPFNTDKADITFPEKITLNLSTGETREVDVTWSEQTPYDKEQAGEYNFQANYTLPSDVTGNAPEVLQKVVVEDKIELKSVTAVDGVEAELGTSKEAAIAKLPAQISITDSKDQNHIVSLVWDIENYDENQKGEYKATGTFVLPDGVYNSSTVENKVETTVTVVDSMPTVPVNKTDLQNLVDEIDGQNLDSTKYTKASFDKLNEELQRSRNVLADENASQSVVNNALQLLRQAKDSLVSKPDTTNLQNAIDLANEKLVDKAKYEDATVSALEDAVKKAQDVLAKDDFTANELADAQNKIADAISKLKEKTNGGGNSPISGGGSGGSGGAGGSSNSDITVYFSLQSIERGGEKKENWVAKKSYKLPRNSKVIDLIDKALKENNIEYSNKGNYIDTIKSPVDGKWFGEFDNGKNSGWMYRVNGKHTLKGVEEYVLSNNDEVFFFYTNDYTKEPGSEEWNKVPNQGANPNGNVATENKKLPFIDVKEDAWYFEAINKLFTLGIIKGKTIDSFEPNTGVTRAEIVSMLYRINPDSKKYDSIFSDVKENDWYNEAISWAAKNKIVKGYGNGKFMPNKLFTREELAEIINNYLKFTKYQKEAKFKIDSLKDFSVVSDWAKESVKEMYVGGIVKGDNLSKFNSKNTATRAEISEMISRIIK